MSLQRQFSFDAPLSPDPLNRRSAFTPVRQPRKRVREVCRENANRLRDEAKKDSEEGRETRAQQVLRCLSAHFNRYAYWPTPAELTEYMHERGELPRKRPGMSSLNIVAPRCSELVNGEVRRGPDGSKIRVGGGVCELLPLRVCKINGDDAHPVKVREVGSKEPR